MPKKKDWLLIAAVALAAVLLFAASKRMPKTDLSKKTADATLAPDAVEYLSDTPAPVATPTPQAAEATPEAAGAPETTPAPEQAAVAGPMPPKKAETVRGYVVLTVGGRQYGDPIPMDRDKIITLRQDDGKINQVHITPEKVYMESSTCENQDCVGQGEVHVDTWQDRILGSYIICLPNSVTIELVPAE